jgi:hypothetical protein
VCGFEQVGLVKPKKRWLFFGGDDAQKAGAPKDKTLADLWVEFLLQEAAESTPATPRSPAAHDHAHARERGH